MKNRISDLIIENFGVEASQPVHLTHPAECERLGFRVYHSARENSRYHTIVTGRLWEAPADDRRRCIRLCAVLLSEYMRHAGICRDCKILFAGIGNPDVASDSIGPKSCDRILVTRGSRDMRSLGFPEVSAVKPGVPSRTGIDTAEQIKLLAAHMDADLIITADSVAARAQERLQTVIQISDCGMTPGSALSHTSGEISKETMPCPVISFGIPMVIRADVLSGDFASEPMFVTRAETDAISDCYADIIAGAINLAITGNHAF